MSKRNKMPGLRLKGGIWQIEKRCKEAEGGWLRESTGCTSRTEAEEVLIRRLADAALYAVNAGCREREVCQLRWEWEVKVPALDTSVFILPESLTKTSTERVVILNSIARRVVEARRGIDQHHVFTYRGKPLGKLRTSAWRRAWGKAGLPTEDGILKGVHNLRHTFGRRLRGAGVSLETRKALLGHASGDITTHYSQAELGELLAAAEMVTKRGLAEAPTLTVIKRCGGVGKLSETKKG